MRTALPKPPPAQMPRTMIEDTLRVAHEVSLRVNGAVIFARVVRPFRGATVIVKPWGRRELLTLNIRDITSVVVVTNASWKLVQRKTAEQRTRVA